MTWPMYYDRDGQPMSRDDYASKLVGEEGNEDGYKRVGSWHGEGGVWVSTVWLGIDHAFGAGPPIIFETMIFGPDDYPYSDECTRYCTEIDAYEGHQRTVADVEAGRTPWFLRDTMEDADHM